MVSKSRTKLASAAGRWGVDLAAAIRWRVCALILFSLFWGSESVMLHHATAAETIEKPCSTLDECLRLVGAPGTCCGISKDEQALAQRIWEIGAPAIPGLIDLLDDPNEQVRERVGYILRDIGGLNASHLPALIDARRRGNGWIPPAIARIGTPEAMRFLVDDLHRDPELDTQVTWALVSRSGEAIPYLLDEFTCTDDCDPRFFRAVGSVLREIGDVSAAAVPRLMAIAADDGRPLALRIGAIGVLGDIGRPAAAAAPFLRALLLRPDTVASETSAELGTIAAYALFRLGDAAAVPSLVEAVRSESGWRRAFAVRDIASLGPSGIAAGPFVRGLLTDPDWDVRVQAAEALGWIGYREAIPDLFRATENADWRLVYQAAWALGVLGAREAAPRLEQIRDSYWYPVVRVAASEALETLQTGRVGAADHGWDAISRRMEQLDELTRRAADCKSRRVFWQDKWLVPAPTSEGETELKIESGTFIGTNNGEWGGELYFRDLAGRKTKLAEDNILGIYQTSSGMVAVAGLAHLTLNWGRIYALNVSSTGGDWRAATLLTLPGEPHGLAVTPDGDLLIVAGDWSVAMRRGAAIEWLPCR